MATTVVYNGVTIAGCVTREFDQELLYDASGTDLIATRYKLGFEGHVHAQAVNTLKHGIQAIDVPRVDGPITVQFDRVSQLLSEPRRTFIMSWDGQPVLVASAATADLSSPNSDVDNGPKPRGLAVMQVTPESIKVRWSVEIMLSGCPGVSDGTIANRKPPFKVINNRWSIAEARDSDFFTTRRISGTIRFAEGLTPKHAYIGVIMPGLERGFRRESIEYETAATGLEASYAVVDKQVHYSAPYPATDMDVTHSYSTNDALTWLDECNVTLRGSPEADRRLLLQRLIQIIDARCEGLRVVADDDGQYLIESIVITEHFGQGNVVNGVMVIRHMGEGTRVTLGNILENKLGKPLELPEAGGQPYDRTISRTPALHGYDSQGKERGPAFLFLLTCYHQDPCGTVKNIFGGSQTGSEQDAGEQKDSAPYPIEVPGGSLPTGSDANYSDSHKVKAYTLARMHSRYTTDRLRVMLPLAVAAAGTGETAEAADLAAGMTRRIILYEAERVGDWPEIPEFADSYTDGSTTGKLLKSWVQPQPPSLAADGRKKIYAVKTKAVYGLNRVPGSDSLAVGVLPFTSIAASAAAFPYLAQQNNSIGP